VDQFRLDPLLRQVDFEVHCSSAIGHSHSMVLGGLEEMS
jgi:hypothetical protein